MDPGSTSTPSPEKPPHPLTDVIGALIALVTLILPFTVIVYYSTSPAGILPPGSYTLQNLQE